MPITAEDLVRVGDAVEHWADHQADEPALTFGDRTWTWSAWRDRIRRVAGALREAGIAVGGRVAVLNRNHPSTLEVMLGAGSIGASTAIINWRLAADELDYVLDDCGATVVVVGADLAGSLETLRPRLKKVEHVVVVGGDDDAYEGWLREADPVSPDPSMRGTEVVVVMYSSGTTGRPKGVMLSHRAMIAHTFAVPEAFAFEEGDVNLVAMPLFHVGGTAYSLFGLFAGIPTIMTVDPDAASLLAALDAGATHAFLVPAVITRILGAGDDIVGRFSALRYLGYGASPMALPHLRRALEAWPDVQFFQVYGMTELCGVVCVLDPPAHRDGDHEERLNSAGRPVRGAELRIVDPETGEDAEPGAPGELWFRTVQAMDGYLNQPEATAETITDDGWLRSGDIGRQDEDGFVFIVDRVKDMIITGGENVYSPEVERVLSEHPHVAEAAVIGVPDDDWGESVKAIVVADGDLDPDDLIAHCRRQLAGYKVPRSVDVVDELPRNPTGKVLKKSLREPYWSGRDRQV